MASEWYTAIIYRSSGKLAVRRAEIVLHDFVTPVESHCVAYAEVLRLPTSQRNRHVAHLQGEEDSLEVERETIVAIVTAWLADTRHHESGGAVSRVDGESPCHQGVHRRRQVAPQRRTDLPRGQSRRIADEREDGERRIRRCERQDPPQGV